MPMPTPRDLDRCLNHLFGLRRFGIRLGLATIRRMLAQLGDPQRSYAAVHIAGTNGKGSVAAGIASVLQQSGYRVGLYTSPHLVRFNERIQVDGRPIGDGEILTLYRRVRRTLSALDREPTFFEFATAMAFEAFARGGVEWAVIETGMGGRMDATNVIVPCLSVITNVSLEHREYLGPTIARIAFEKAGIVKRRRPVVTGVRQPSALGVLEEIASRRSAPVYRSGRDFIVRKTADGLFDYRGIRLRLEGLRTALAGEHQRANAGLVLAAGELLAPRAPRITERSLREGLAATRWPGRLEAVRERPLVLLDGAHNLDASRALARHVRERYAGRPITLVVGILDDKPYRAMLRHLAPLAARVIATQATTPRALPAAKIAAAASRFCPRVEAHPTVARALEEALRTVPEQGVVLVAGSLYVVGEAKAALEGGLAVQPG
ncbi:MAG: folylpolyglutamate synthase/dihydrofolate synthase family protein [Desulfobacterales bacterium]